jgi:hypothetical protein
MEADMAPDAEALERRIPELRAITDGLAEDLRGRYRDLRIIKDGALQLTIFQPNRFKFLQIVVGIHGVYVLEDTFHADARELAERGVQLVLPSGEVRSHGPLALEDPLMFNKLYQVLDKWTGRTLS